MKNSLFLVLMTALLASCAPKAYLSKAVVKQNSLTTSDLQKIQFYNSRDIVLARYGNAAKDKHTENGTLTINNKNAVEQIVIESGTPGAVTKELEDGKLAVSFEADEAKLLVFGPNKKTGEYQLLAQSWENGRGKVTYGGATYLTNVGTDQCRLTFRMKTVRDLHREMRIAKGRKVE